MSGEPEVGDILAGKYKVERLLGQGGMGVVVQALHIQLEERVAMKFLLPEYAEHPEASTRFLREARAAVKIKSEHVARVVDVGTLETGAPYMVMEYLQGQDLSNVLETTGVLSVEDAIEYILQAAEVLAEAHAHSIVHRDLKPANLFLTQRADGSSIVKVLDFGISKVTVPSESGGDMSLTKTSSMLGSPLYMSPEQMRSSKDVDVRTDMWSIGAILYELLTGEPPFVEDSLPALCSAILEREPPSLVARRDDVKPELEAAIFKCLEKNPDNRYPSVAELAYALAPFGPKRSKVSVERVSRVMRAAGLSQSDMDLGAYATERPPAPANVGAQTQSAWGQTGAGSAPSQSAVIASIAVGLVLLVGGGGAAYLALSGGDDESAVTPPPEAVQNAASGPAAAAEKAAAEKAAAEKAAAEKAAAEKAAAEKAAAEKAAAEKAAAEKAAAEKAAAEKPKPVYRRPAVKKRVAATPKPAPAKAPAPAPKKKSRAAIFGDRQ